MLRQTFWSSLVLLLLVVGSGPAVCAQGISARDRDHGNIMLMRSRLYPHQIGLETVIFYGVSVTDADVLMADGKSLEGVGVTPDEVLLTTAEDLRAEKDPVLSRAAALAGATLDPAEAGKMFPFKWKS